MNYRYRFVRQGDYIRAIPEVEMRPKINVNYERMNLDGREFFVLSDDAVSISEGGRKHPLPYGAIIRVEGDTLIGSYHHTSVLLGDADTTEISKVMCEEDRWSPFSAGGL